MASSDVPIPSAPLPTKRELRRRSNPFIQFGRFVVLSLGIFLLARKHD